jgi:hypothetical protein
VKIPAWYEEGLPTWVMSVLGGGDAASTPLWNEYLDTSTRSLYQRSYDGVGFFAHLAETGTDVWSKIDPIGRALTGGNNKGGWDAAAPGESFLDSWGPGYVRGRYPGTPWNTGGPGLPADHKPDIPNQALANDAALAVDAPVAGVGVKQFDVSAEVLTLLPSGSAHGRFATGLGHDMSLAEAAGTVFCAKPGGCTCPDGSEGAGTQFTQLTAAPTTSASPVGRRRPRSSWRGRASTTSASASAPRAWSAAGPASGTTWRPPARPSTAARASSSSSTRPDR